MITTLCTGRLVKPPKQGQSAKGATWTSATVRAPVRGNREDEPDNVIVNLIAFGAQADRLAALAQGDTVSFTGDARPTAWQKDDGLHAGLSVTVTELITAYALKQRRGDDQGKASGKANTAHAQYFDRAQADAYAEFAKRATAPAHDDFGDSEIPF
jgi:single-stranded DNA-binding protein